MNLELSQDRSIAEVLFEMVASDNRGGGGLSLNNDSILDKLSDIERLLAERRRHGVIKDKVQHLLNYVHISNVKAVP